MARTYRRPAAAAAGLLALAAPAAAAGSTSTYVGGCSFHTAQTGPDSYTGVIWVAAAVYSDATPADNPVSATITCQIRVNGVVQVSAAFSGTTAVVGAAPIAFSAGSLDVVQPCDVVDYTSDDTPTSTICAESAPVFMPPQEVCDVVYYVTEPTPVGRPPIGDCT